MNEATNRRQPFHILRKPLHNSEQRNTPDSPQTSVTVHGSNADDATQETDHEDNAASILAPGPFDNIVTTPAHLESDFDTESFKNNISAVNRHTVCRRWSHIHQTGMEATAAHNAAATAPAPQ